MQARNRLLASAVAQGTLQAQGMVLQSWGLAVAVLLARSMADLVARQNAPSDAHPRPCARLDPVFAWVQMMSIVFGELHRRTKV